MTTGRAMADGATGDEPAPAHLTVGCQGIDVCWEPSIDGGGRSFGQDFLPVVRHLFGRVERVFEYRAGPGFIGFSLLAHGLCGSLALADTDPAAVAAMRETVRRNDLHSRVSVYRSDGLRGIPAAERWDLTVATPPHRAARRGRAPDRITDDPGWRAHGGFYARVAGFLAPGGSVLIQENFEEADPESFIPLIRKGGLEFVEAFSFTPPARPTSYFVWARKALPRLAAPGSGLVPHRTPTPLTVELDLPAPTVSVPADRVTVLTLHNATEGDVRPQLRDTAGQDLLRIPIATVAVGADAELPRLVLGAGEYLVHDEPSGTVVCRVRAVTTPPPAQHPRLRAELDSIPPYLPGRPPPDSAPDPAPHRLSSNENPFAPLPGLLERVGAAAKRLNRYPDRTGRPLTTALADSFGVPPEHVVLGAGSTGLAQQLVQAAAGPGDEVVYAWRSYGLYPVITRIAGAHPVQVPLSGSAHDLEAMAAAVTPRTRLIFVCNPNNPTGTTVRTADVENFLDRVPPDVLVVFDEAYREYVTDPLSPDGIGLYRDRQNVCVLRTFSKAHGLAGLRIGYAIACTPVADALRRTALPYGVSHAAQEAALWALGAEEELSRQVAAVAGERDRMVRELTELGWSVPDSQANFVWLGLSSQAETFAARCAETGVLIRAFPGEGVRVSVGEPAANDLFLRVAGQVSET